jgi:alpha-tubulin suppressor-like RCC1 family protein
VPTRVRTGLAFTTLAAGFGQTCGLVADGAAYCWGDPLLGSLGNGSYGSSIPVPAPVPVSGGHRFRSITTGVGHTCAIDLEDAAWCWGQNDFGEVGAGTGLTGLVEPVPVRMVTELRFRTVSAGDGHTCGIATTGETWCWGRGNKLGQGFIADSKVPVKVVGGVALDSVWASWDQSCGLTAAGAAYCWGINLGGVASSESLWLTPQRIAPGLAFVQLSLRRDGGCGLTADGEAYCWGQSSDGQLGNGSTGSSLQVEPVRVSGPQRYRTLASGAANTCGIATDGRLYCWGAGWSNGRGGTHAALEPQAASFPMTSLEPAVREAPASLRDLVPARLRPNQRGKRGTERE